MSSTRYLIHFENLSLTLSTNIVKIKIGFRFTFIVGLESVSKVLTDKPVTSRHHAVAENDVLFNSQLA